MLRIYPAYCWERAARESRPPGRGADLAFELARPAAEFIGNVDDATVRIADPPSIRVTENDGENDAIAPLTPADVAAALADRLPSAGGDPTVIELGVETGPAASDTASALGDGIAPDAVV